MPGLWTRIKTWSATDTVINTDLNAEFDNILTYFTPQYMDDYSGTATQMRVQTDPGEVGTESLATSMSAELERLRFAISEIKGTTYWYSTATTSLSQISTALGTNLLANRISSGRTSANSSQPIFLVPDGTAATVTAKGSPTSLVYSIASTQYTVSTNISVTGLTTAPASNNTCLVNDTALSGQTYSKLVGENGSSLIVDNMGSEITALTGKIAAFKTGATEYFLARVKSTTELDKLTRGAFFNSADTRFSRVALSNNDTITLMKLTWIFATAAGALAITYANPRYGAVTPTSPAIGDYWFDTTNNIWKVYNGTSFADATATLIGICLQDTTGCKAARSADFFKSYSDLNTVEVMRDSTTELRSRFAGAQLSVYGTTTSWTNDFVRFNTTTDFDSGESLATNTMYYLYLKETGTPVISTVAPLDMRNERRGYYHPGETWRCVAFGRTDATGSGEWTQVESLYTSDKMTLVTNLTASVTNLLPVPYNIQFLERSFTVSGSAGNMTQTLPPAAQFRGDTFSYVRTDNTPANVVTIAAYGVETINGSATTTLNTQYENLRLLSDGSNWWVIGRYFPSTWIDGGTITLAGTTTAPTKGGTTVDHFWWRRSGDSLQGRFEYQQTSGGNAGSGDYLFKCVPTGLTVDTAKLTVYTTVEGAGLCNKSTSVGNAAFGGSATSGGPGGSVAPYDTTQVRLIYLADSAAGGLEGYFSSGGILPFNTTNMSFSAVFTVPITGWAG